MRDAQRCYGGSVSACVWTVAGLIPVGKIGTAAKLLKKGDNAGAARLACATPHSFLPGTEVLLADGTTKLIEDVELGDAITVTDPLTGETTNRKVVATIVTEDDKRFVDLTVRSADGDSSELISTVTHPFWVESSESWVDAGNLKPGMTLRTAEGEAAEVEAVRPFDKRQRTYDLTVEGIHTYYVLAGNTPVLVHNASPDCGLFPNSMPGTLDRELALADRLGVTPSGAGSAGFDSAVGSGTVKWAVREDGSLVVVPKFVDGQEISHAALTRGAPVRAAGEADIAGSSGDGFFGLDINNHSGHFLPSSESLQIGSDAFAAAGVHF